MCRNIRVLHNFQPPTTPDEIRAASLQYVRKVSGLAKPSQADAPEGTLWARELHTIGREGGAATGGQLQLKFYLGGIAGDEMQSLARVHKAQLDGEAGALFC